MLSPMTLSTVVIAFESEEAARRRLEDFGYASDVAAEIAVYLAQSTDLPQVSGEIARELAVDGLQAEFVPLDGLPRRLRELASRREETIVWALTDGIRFYRGSAVPALARLEGFAQFGSRATAAHLAQDKFAGLALASAAGLAVPPTRLMEGHDELASLGSQPPAGPLFVKPNTLGAKIGIFADSLCSAERDAIDRARRIWDRYRDRALIQPFVEGDDVRASFIDCGGAFAGQIGVEQIARNPASETGGAFLTMKDNETLSGARDTSGGRGGFGAVRRAAFVPRMIDLRRQDDERSRRAVAAVFDASTRLARLVGLRDCFSIDFRIDDAGRPAFFEFEVSPAVTIYDFQNYLAGRGLTLGGALAKAMRLAFARRRAIGEA
jgi:D-alanine-D-alanine ligase-like ATP-grasp enzyme